MKVINAVIDMIFFCLNIYFSQKTQAIPNGFVIFAFC